MSSILSLCLRVFLPGIAGRASITFSNSGRVIPLALILLAVTLNLNAQEISVSGARSNPKETVGAEGSRVDKDSVKSGKIPPSKYYDFINLEHTRVHRLARLQNTYQPRDEPQKKLRTGVVRRLEQVNILADSPSYQIPEGNVRIVGIVSEGALSVRVHFSKMLLPEGARVFVYSMNNPTEVYGPYEGKGPLDGNDFWSPPVKGDGVVIEYINPVYLTAEAPPPFKVLEINHQFRNFSSGDSAQAASCHNDVGPGYANVGSAVGYLEFMLPNGGYICTGTLLNTQASSFVPYLITANHCFDTQAAAQSLRVYWNYNSGDSPPPGTSFTDGASLLSTNSTSDYTFVRLTGTVPGGLWYNGWTTTMPVANDLVAGIHHPSGSHKRISFGYADPSSTDCPSNLPGPCQNFVKVFWNSGTTEGGSSGSELVVGSASDPRYVGNLWGGNALCDTNGRSFYGRFDVTYPQISPYLSGAPLLSSSLTISPSGPYSINQTVTARFTLTNRGSTTISLRNLTAGGRLNGDNTCSGGCPDFPFANNITLNPGASYNYIGSQSLSRAGNYSFFVAYQKVDGSWITNMPTDAGVSNTASLVVGSGGANPMVSANLALSGQSCTGGVLTAQFSITNRGSSAITLSRLTAGGRLNGDNSCSGGCPDFPFANNITLNSGQTYNYSGSQTLTRTGNYSFFVAYQKTDGSWVTNVPVDAGISNTASTSVSGPCSGANPVVSASLTLSGDSCTGGILTARFTITNRGSAGITLQRLTAGGRLNGDNTGAGGFPDFPFANNVVLNAGASFSYVGSQTLTRTGIYSFFVAYQRTDGSWVTNVPTDAGVSNTASRSVTGPCGGANPVVSSSLTITGQSCTGGVLNAQFTITNRGSAAITLQRLTAGGRLNGDNTGAGGFPDFPFANNVVLNAGASFNYVGSQTLTRTGNYSFFVAYQKTDGSWVTNVPTDAGVSNTASTTVSGPCGGANPVVSASLILTGQTCTGGVLSAQFTLTNRGSAAITLQRLTAGGRLNGDNTGAGGFPDFPFANNVVLNPGASFNYSGSQTLTRTGAYSFFVAYQRTDGSWVTNVPTDAGVSNTASASVTGPCGSANPMVSSSLTLSPAGPYVVGNNLTARFSLTNRGTAAVTFNYIVAGGRLNGDNSCSGGCPDFSFATGITLNPGATYNYVGTQTMTRAGNYSFFVAYHTNSAGWVTNVPTDPGVSNTVSITVGSGTQTIAWEFNSFGNAEGWSATNASATSVNNGSYFIDPSGSDPFIVSPAISAGASTYQYFIVRMASNGLDSTGAVYFKTQTENFYSDDKKVVFTVSNCSLCGNAGFVRYAVFMAGHSKWSGTITGLRLDPTGSGQGGTNSDSIGIDYIRLSSSSLALNFILPFKEDHLASDLTTWRLVRDWDYRFRPGTLNASRKS